MPLVNPIISRTVPVKVGGTPTAGAGMLASAFDHVHPLTETSGPTNLSLTTWRDTEILYRSSGNVLGKRLQWFHTTAVISTTSTTLQTFGSVALARAGTYIFEWIGAPYSALAAVQVAFNYSGATTDRCMTVFRPDAPAGSLKSANTQTFNQKVGATTDTYGDGSSRYMHAYGYIVATASGTFSLLYCSGTNGNNAGFDIGSIWGIRESG